MSRAPSGKRLRPVGYSIVCVDPGVTTGVMSVVVGREDLTAHGPAGAMAKARRRGLLWVAEVDGNTDTERGDAVVAWLMQREAHLRLDTNGHVRRHLAIVIEDFILRERSQSRDLLAPVRVTSVIEARLEAVGRMAKVVKQQPGQKAVITSDRLKRAGLWYVGSEHVRDAVRHAVVYLRTHQHELTKGVQV